MRHKLAFQLYINRCFCGANFLLTKIKDVKHGETNNFNLEYFVMHGTDKFKRQ